MPKINTYNLDETIRPDDLLIGSSLEGTFNGQDIYSTRNYKLEKLAEFFIGYDFNAGLSLTTIEGLVNQNIIDIGVLNTSLTALTGRVAVNEANILSGQSLIATNTSNIATNASSISTINSNISNRANWDDAYQESISSISVSTNPSGSVKTITLTRRNGTTLFDDFTDIFESGAGGITDTNNYVNSVLFNASTGVLTLGRVDLDDLTVNLDGRYIDLTSSQTISGQKTFTTNSPRFDSYISLLEGAPTGSIAGYGALTAQAGGILRFSPANQTFAGRLAFPGFTAQRTFTFPDVSGTVALTSDLSAYSAVGHTHVTADITDLASYTGFDSRYVNITGDTITGPITFNDNTQLRFGGLGDFRLYHNGTNNIIHSDNGNWIFYDGAGVGTNRVVINKSSGETTINGRFNVNSPVVQPITVKGIGLRADGTVQNYWMAQDSAGINAWYIGQVNAANTDLTIYNYRTTGSGTYLRLGENGILYYNENTIWHSGNDGHETGLDADLLDGLEASEFAKLSGATFSGEVVVNAITDVNSLSFSPSIASADANTVNTFIPRTNSLLVKNQSGATNYPSANGQHLTIRGSSDSRTFSFWRNNDSNTLYYGTWDGIAWTWNEVWHENNDGSGTGLDADFLDGLDSLQFLRSDVDSTMLGFLTFAADKGVKGNLYNNSSQVILNNPAGSGDARWFKGNLLGTINDPLSASVDTVVYDPGTGTLYKDMLMDTGVRIIFNSGTPQEEILSAESISATQSAFNSIITGGTTGSTITFTRLSGLAGDQYSITNIARLNSNNIFTGTLEATDFILSSDISLKENIKDYSVAPIEINYKSYNLIADNDKNTRVGVIAQELEQSHPEFVRENENGVKSVSYIDLLMAKVAELEERIKQLENGDTR